MPALMPCVPLCWALRPVKQYHPRNTLPSSCSTMLPMRTMKFLLWKLRSCTNLPKPWKDSLAPSHPSGVLSKDEVKILVILVIKIDIHACFPLYSAKNMLLTLHCMVPRYFGNYLGFLFVI